MRTVLVALVTLAIALGGCSAEDVPPAATIEFSAPPPIDEEYSGSYQASLNFTPPIENPDRQVRVDLDADETILKGWFVPKDHEPIQGFASGRTLFNLPPLEGDRFLIDYLETLTDEFTSSARRIDLVILTIEDPSGNVKTVSITSPRFEIIS